MRRRITWLLSAFKYVVAVFMMYAGVATMFADTRPVSDVSFIYSSRTALVVLGMFFFAAGLTLFIGKVTKMRKVVGHGLFMTYISFIFGFILNWIAIGWDHAWPNLIGSFVVGALYLRWKYHIYYYEPPLDKVRAKMLEYEPLDTDRIE